MKHSEISTLKQLANYLRVTSTFLERAIKTDYTVIDSKGVLFMQDFSNPTTIIIEKFQIQKKGKAGGKRGVHAVRDFNLSSTLRILNSYLAEIFNPEPFVHGFIKGRNTKTNAQPHLAKKRLLSLDIENFFGSISENMVTEGLIEIGFKKNIAEYLSKLTTINGFLIQGFNTSPTIANIVTDKMDKDLISLCDNRTTYTRYADDLSFSSNETLPSVDEIRLIISKHGFKLNDDKTNLMKRGHYQYVTGLTVFDNKTPRIPKTIKRNLRLEVYYVKKFGYQKHAIRRLNQSGLVFKVSEYQLEINEEILAIQHRLFGWIHYIKSVEPKIASKLYDDLIRCGRYSSF